MFIRALKIERDYARRLRAVARHVGDLLSGFDIATVLGVAQARSALERYAATLAPWARSVGQRMVAEVAQRDERAWFRLADQMGAALRQEIRAAPTGQVLQARLSDQVTLITSLPAEAAQRVHRLTVEGVAKGWRSDRIAEEILRTGEVTRARANLIARTEVSRTATLLTQARAEHVGSEGYIWKTMRDVDVRPSHEAMQGRFVRWNAPPTLDDLTGHAGALPNCRCWCEPVLPD